jgi:hypothetical protein
MSIVLAVLAVPETLVSLQLSLIVATVVLFVISLTSSRRQTKMSRLSSRTLLVRALDLVAVVDVVADALEAVAVEVQPTATSVNSEEVVLVVARDSEEASADRLLSHMVADLEVLLQLLTVEALLLLMEAAAVDTAAPMATHLEAAAANLGGNPHSTTLLCSFSILSTLLQHHRTGTKASFGGVLFESLVEGFFSQFDNLHIASALYDISIF